MPVDTNYQDNDDSLDGVDSDDELPDFDQTVDEQTLQELNINKSLSETPQNFKKSQIQQSRSTDDFNSLEKPPKLNSLQKEAEKSQSAPVTAQNSPNSSPKREIKKTLLKEKFDFTAVKEILKYNFPAIPSQKDISDLKSNNHVPKYFAKTYSYVIEILEYLHNVMPLIKSIIEKLKVNIDDIEEAITIIQNRGEEKKYECSEQEKLKHVFICLITGIGFEKYVEIMSYNNIQVPCVKTLQKNAGRDCKIIGRLCPE